MKSLAKDHFWRWGFWVAAGGVAVLCLVPEVPREVPQTGWDKTNHLFVFAVLGLLGRRAYGTRFGAVLAGLLAYGGLIELLQSFTASRQGEWADLLADGLGLALAGVLGTVLDGGLAGKLARPILALPRAAKRLVALSLDICLCIVTVWLALSLRLETWVPPGHINWWAAAGSIALALPVFINFELYRAVFRYSGGEAMSAILRAWSIYALAYAVPFTLVGVEGVPRTVGLVQPVLLLFGMAASRMLARSWLGSGSRAVHRRPARARASALIYGAGSAGQQLSEALSDDDGMRVVGFVDDDRRLHGGTIRGLPVYGPQELRVRVREQKVTNVLLAIPSAPRKRRNEILQSVMSAHVAVRTLPGLTELAQGHVQTSDLRELEIDDMLGRDAVAPDRALLDGSIRGKVVLVTGAGGSIGSELCRQILKSGPGSLLLVERSEYALYAIHIELEKLLSSRAGKTSGSAAQTMRLVPLLASVGDESRMREIMSTWRPHTVYHAAAYKHVPLVEHNAAEGVKNNVFGTLVAARTAAEAGVALFVLVSTDKAVRPTNVMGTTKRMAEMALQALAAKMDSGPGGTCFCMVRFGNVLGSSGSVVPLFRRQIREGGPITLTHPEITRYFMTIPEAAQLVIQAGAMATGGEVFVLDMGEPVKIIDLARRMVELSGLTVCDEAHPDGDIAIHITGLRPGEKLYEELLIGDNPMRTQHPRIMKAHEDFLAWVELRRQLDALWQAVEANQVLQLREVLQQTVAGYRPADDVVDWVYRERTDFGALTGTPGP